MELDPRKHLALLNKPQKFVAKAATSTLNTAAKVLNVTQHKVNKLQHRRDLSSEKSILDDVTSESSSHTRTSTTTDTFSTSMSYYSGYDTTYLTRPSVPRTMELPKPSCRLGDVQAEWEGADIGWRLIILDSELQNLESNLQVESNDTATLRNVNIKLKCEQELLKTKLEILANSVVEKTALVSLLEEKLEKMRIKARQCQDATTAGDITTFSHHPQEIPKPTNSTIDDWPSVSSEVNRNQNNMRVNNSKTAKNPKKQCSSSPSLTSSQETEDDDDDEETGSSGETQFSSKLTRETASEVTSTETYSASTLTGDTGATTTTTRTTKTVQFAD